MSLQRTVMSQMPGTPLKGNASPEKFRKDNQGFSATSWLKYLKRYMHLSPKNQLMLYLVMSSLSLSLAEHLPTLCIPLFTDKFSTSCPEYRLLLLYFGRFVEY